MSELISRTARLVPYTKRPKSAASFVTAYFYEPAADEIGARLGNFFVVVEVLVSGRASEEVVDLIIQTAGEKYYNEPTDETDPLARFEAAVKQTNHELSEYVGRGNAAWIGKLSAIFAVQAGSELHIAQTGSAEAFLYRGKAVSRISLSEPARPASPSKTFGSIASGQLDVGDKLLLTTPALIHQIPLKKLQQTISGTSPNVAITEISQLLEGASTHRIAAIVVEVTTPELAALQVRSEAPHEIELGNKDSLAETAVQVAAPLAHTTVKTSRQAAQVVSNTWSAVHPHARRLSLAAAERLRQALSTRRGQITVGLAVLAAIIIVSVLSLTSSQKTAAAKEFGQYQGLYQQYEAAQAKAETGDKTGARTGLVKVQTALAHVNTGRINTQLANSPVPQGEPSTVAGFISLVNDHIDQLDGLVKAEPTIVTEIKAGRIAHFETDGTRAYLFDAAHNNAITIVNLTTGNQADSAADTSKLGDVVSTTLSAGKDGIYILTSKPSVWFYRFAGDNLTEQPIQYDTWPKASAIASYSSNLYLLGENAVFKHARNATGYSPKSQYVDTSTYGTGATALAVDGYIYIAGPSGLKQLLGTAVHQSVASPGINVTNLRSTAGGDVIIGASTSGRVAVWTDKSDHLAFSKQVNLTGIQKLYDATYDAKSGKGYATVDNRLVSFPLVP